MKKNVFYLLLAVFAFVVLPSCGDDKEEDTDYAPEIAKTYDGALQVAKETPTASTIVVSRVETNKVKLTLKDFTYPGIPSLGDITVEDVAVTKEGDILLSAKNKQVTVNLLGNPTPVFIDVAGTYKTGSLVLNITIKDAPVVGTITAYFTTDKSIIPAPEPSIPPATGGSIWTALNGEYAGTLTINMGTEQAISSVLVVKKTGGWKVQFTVNNVPMAETIIFQDITVTENTDKTCAFSGSISNGQYSATITGSAKNVGEIEFSGTIEVAAMSGVIIPVSYVGSKSK